MKQEAQKGKKVQKKEGQSGKEAQVPKRRRVSRRAPVRFAVYINRLWVKAAFLGFRRAYHQQNENQALVKIQGVNDVKSSTWYFGKRVALVYKGHTLQNNTKYRAIWGRICRAHGNNGVVIARFLRNLPPKSIGATLRVFLYPHRFDKQ